MATNPNPVGVLGLVAATPPAGYTLVNGTGNIVTWTPPNDGALHPYLLIAQQIVTSNMTGGELAIVFNAADGTLETQQLSAAGLTTGVYGPGSFSWLTGFHQGGQPLVIEQFTALTLGAAKFWCQLWAR
jgi:hypothetical protein